MLSSALTDKPNIEGLYTNRSLATSLRSVADRLLLADSDEEAHDYDDASRNLGYVEWLTRHFPDKASHPLADRHHRLWQWFAALRPGRKVNPLVEIWGRGGAKSATTEFAVAFCGERLLRNFCLYVSGTQAQADKHVGSISSAFGRIGMKRALNEYGYSKGWKHSELRVNNDFNVAAIGLDSASRGIKLDQFRPDLIILDDIDDREDTPATVEKKIRAITNTILPTQSPDCAILFIQNLIHEDSIAAMLVADTADFLRFRSLSPIEPAVRNLEYQTVYDEDLQRNVYRILGGEATWEGQNLETCEYQLNEWGEAAFLAEAQHQVANAAGYVFDDKAFGECDPGNLPRFIKASRAWDLAGTEGGGDYTATQLAAVPTNERVYVLSACHEQLSSDHVYELMLETVLDDFEWLVSSEQTFRLTWLIPQDPAQAGKAQKQQLHMLLTRPEHSEWLDAWLDDHSLTLAQFREILNFFEVVIKPVGGKGTKPVRARGWAGCVNIGNAYLVRGSWNAEYKAEHRRFREDMSHNHDDFVDTGSDNFNHLVRKREQKPFEIW